MKRLVGSLLFACCLGTAFAETVAWWRFEGTPGVQTVEGDTFANSATGESALPALTACSMNGTTFGYDQTYMPRYMNAFCTGYEIYDPVTDQTYANTASLSLRDALTATANKYNGVATMPATSFPATGDVTIECFYRAPFLDDEGENVKERGDMIPILCLQHGDWAYSAYIALYNKKTAGAVTTNQYYFGYAFRNAAGEKRSNSGSARGLDVADNKWHHVAQVFDFTDGKVRCFVDYKELHSATIPEDAVGVYFDETNHFIVGGSEWNSNRKLQGYVDEVRITKGALASAQFLRMRAPSSSVPADVLAHVSFEKPDWWGGGLNLDFSCVTAAFSIPYFSSAKNAVAPAPVASLAGSSMYAGVYDTAGVANASACDLNRTSPSVGSVLTLDYEAEGAETLLENEPEFTIEFYAKFKSDDRHANYYPILSDGGYSFRWYFLTNTTTKVCDGSRLVCDVQVLTNATTGTTKLYSLNTGNMSSSVCDGNWHHFSLRFSTAMKRASVDIDHGRFYHKEQALAAETLGFKSTVGKLVLGGLSSSMRLCDMVVDELRVTKRYLEDHELLNTYHQTAEEQMTTPRAWVRFENDWTVGPDLGLGTLASLTLTCTKASGTTTDPAFLANTRKPLLREAAGSPTIPNVACASLVQKAYVLSDDLSTIRNLRDATYEAFVKVNAISNAVDSSKSTHLFFAGRSSQNPDVGMRLSRYSETKYNAQIIWCDKVNHRVALAITPFDDGQWHHHAITFAETTNAVSGAVSTTVTYYRDYAQQAQTVVDYARVMSTMAEKTVIGSGETWGAGHDFEIDEIRVSAGVLEPSAFMRRWGLGFGLFFR